MFASRLILKVVVKREEMCFLEERVDWQEIALLWVQTCVWSEYKLVFGVLHLELGIEMDVLSSVRSQVDDAK